MSVSDHELRIAISTGKVYIGSKMALREVRRGRAKMVILSSNCPAEIAERLIELGALSNVPVLRHMRTSIDLGALCGKPFPISAIVINEPGDSKILSAVKEADA